MIFYAEKTRLGVLAVQEYLNRQDAKDARKNSQRPGVKIFTC